MKFSQKNLRSNSRIFLILALILILIYIIFFTNLIKKNCNEDNDCFNAALQKCKAAKLIYNDNNNIYSYVIKGKSFNNCILYVKMEKAAEGVDLEIKDLLEGKDMTCKIPMNELENVKMGEIDNLVNYCHGQLKEGLYEMIIKRMYALVVKQMGGILKEFKDVLSEI